MIFNLKKLQPFIVYNAQHSGLTLTQINGEFVLMDFTTGKTDSYCDVDGIGELMSDLEEKKVSSFTNLKTGDVLFFIRFEEGATVKTRQSRYTFFWEDDILMYAKMRGGILETVKIVSNEHNESDGAFTELVEELLKEEREEYIGVEYPSEKRD